MISIWKIDNKDRYDLRQANGKLPDSNIGKRNQYPFLYVPQLHLGIKKKKRAEWKGNRDQNVKWQLELVKMVKQRKRCYYLRAYLKDDENNPNALVDPGSVLSLMAVRNQSGWWRRGFLSEAWRKQELRTYIYKRRGWVGPTQVRIEVGGSAWLR